MAVAKKSATKSKPIKTRYEEVKAMLNKAAAGSKATYQGYGRFWNLPLEQFMELEVYGIRMIAPAKDHSCDELLGKPTGGGSCCAKHETEADDAVPLFVVEQPLYPGRGKASGLIKGLKGEFPFNEEHFPALPWGGTALEVSQIQFISDWIDDGCPKDDPIVGKAASAVAASADTAIPKDAAKSTDASVGLEAATFTNRAVDYFPPNARSLNMRKNLAFLSEDEVHRMRCAIYELRRLNRYPLDKRNLNSYGRLHGDTCQHGWEQFLTWHRMFIYEFEQALKDIDPSVNLAYWDWPMPRYNNGLIPKGGYSAIIPSAYQCWVNQDALDRLEEQGYPSKLLAKLKKIKDQKYNSGPELFLKAGFTREEYYAHGETVNKQLELVNPLWYKFRYPGMFYKMDSSGNFVTDKEGNPIIVGEEGLHSAPFHHHYPTAEDVHNIVNVDNWRDFGGGPEYDQSFGVLDMDPHNTIHIWVGGYNYYYNYLHQKDQNKQRPDEPIYGDMLANLTAGYDPIFWPHHVNVDRTYSRWQRKNPNQHPEDMGGGLAGLGYSVRDAMSIRRLGYEYIVAARVFHIDRSQGIKRFNGKVSIDKEVLEYSSRIELRLHQMEQPQHSFALRAFVNTPDASLDTAVQGNQNFAGYMSFFGHGDCIGGPGHCDPPPLQKRLLDRRQRHHNTPGNFKMDISQSVFQLVDQADDDGCIHFELNLISIGANGGALTDLLQLEAISIIFMD